MAYSWTSSDLAIATVYANGRVKLPNPGNTNIQAAAGDVAYCWAGTAVITEQITPTADQVPTSVKLVQLKGDSNGDFWGALGYAGWLCSYGNSSGRCFGNGSSVFVGTTQRSRLG